MQGLEGWEVMSVHDGEPSNQGAFTVRVLFPKMSKSLARDDMHFEREYRILR